jgi:hypothetical protein
VIRGSHIPSPPEGKGLHIPSPPEGEGQGGGDQSLGRHVLSSNPVGRSHGFGCFVPPTPALPLKGGGRRSGGRGRFPRALVAGLAALVAFVVQPGVAGEAGLDASANSDCPAAASLPAVTGQVLTFTGRLQCFQPGAPTFGTNVAPQDFVVRDSNPFLGESCQNVYYYPVSFSEAVSGGPWAVFAFAGQATAGTFPLSPGDATMIGGHDAYVSDVRLGSYELSNLNDPSSPLVCVLGSTFHWYCPATNTLEEFCYTWVDHPISPISSPPPPWGPYFAAAVGSIAGEAGTIHSSPSRTGVVNAPVCYWVDGMGIPVERDLTLTLAGPPDSSGRQIFYTFLARIRFDGITWNFDDPYDNSTSPTPLACGSHPLLAAHQYRQISDGRHPDNRYHVSAVEQYSITVVVYWVEFDGLHGPVQVDPGVGGAAISPNAYAQYVGQVEGVPIGSP